MNNIVEAMDSMAASAGVKKAVAMITMTDGSVMIIEGMAGRVTPWSSPGESSGKKESSPVHLRLVG